MKKCMGCGNEDPKEFYRGKNSRCKKCLIARQIEYKRERGPMSDDEKAQQKIWKRSWYERNKKASPIRLRWEKPKSPPTYGRFGNNHDNTLRRLKGYGIQDLAERADIIALLENMPTCPVCGRVPDKANPLVIDHDHTTGTFRGILCSNCNSGLGFFGDSPESCRSAALYLERSRK